MRDTNAVFSKPLGDGALLGLRMGSSVLAFSSNVVDGGSWRKVATLVDTKALKDFFLFFFFAEGLCVVWMGQLPP